MLNAFHSSAGNAPANQLASGSPSGARRSWADLPREIKHSIAAFALGDALDGDYRRLAYVSKQFQGDTKSIARSVRAKHRSARDRAEGAATVSMRVELHAAAEALRPRAEQAELYLRSLLPPPYAERSLQKLSREERGNHEFGAIADDLYKSRALWPTDALTRYTLCFLPLSAEAGGRNPAVSVAHAQEVTQLARSLRHGPLPNLLFQPQLRDTFRYHLRVLVDFLTHEGETALATDFARLYLADVGGQDEQSDRKRNMQLRLADLLLQQDEPAQAAEVLNGISAQIMQPSANRNQFFELATLRLLQTKAYVAQQETVLAMDSLRVMDNFFAAEGRSGVRRAMTDALFGGQQWTQEEGKRTIERDDRKTSISPLFDRQFDASDLFASMLVLKASAHAQQGGKTLAKQALKHVAEYFPNLAEVQSLVDGMQFNEEEKFDIFLAGLIGANGMPPAQNIYLPR